MDVGSIEPADLKIRIESGERFTLIDVREDDERAYCAIKTPDPVDDLHIPMNQIPARFDEIAAASVPLVIYCHHGVRSMVVAQWLAKRDVAGVWNLEGGIDAWSLKADRGVPRY
jgi:rhodanese-related sulfurtransferase